MASARDPDAEEEAPPRQSSIDPVPPALATLFALASWLLVESVPADPGEPAWLRWGRVAGAHPLRSWGAIFLLTYALRPRRGDRARAEACKMGPGGRLPGH